ncbi:hypothetical protein DRJ25_06235 [Candidatus Woesearchaeota archaeon]|nr:MAG: hypothetical protein DRJ25_06235 [Candidatus Woesearchaeota archaeon]
MKIGNKTNHTPYKFPDTKNGIKILEHLPFEPKAKRYVIAECPACKEPWNVRMDSLTTGRLCMTCGNKQAGKGRIKHGLCVNNSTHELVSAWTNMKGRCNGSHSQSKEHYFNKGITVCKEWEKDMMSFVEWSFKNGWEKGLELDKDILSDKLNISPKIYSPETCQWITAKENLDYARNTGNSKRDNPEQ